MPDVQTEQNELACKLIAQTSITMDYQQLGNRALQATREYQDILIGVERARTSRAIAKAWIDLGALVVQLVLTAGGAIVLKGLLRGQGLYAKLAMTQLEAAAVAGRSFQTLRAWQWTRAARLGKQLPAPTFVVRAITEFWPRFVFGAQRAALASATYGSLRVAAANMQDEERAFRHLPMGKIGEIRRQYEAGRWARRPAMAITIDEQRLMAELSRLHGSIDPLVSSLLQVSDENWGASVGMLDHELTHAMQQRQEFTTLDDESKLALRSQALLDFWYQLMGECERKSFQHQQVLHGIADRLRRLDMIGHMDVGALNRSPEIGGISSH